MESVNVKKLLDAYFEGNTSLEEEKALQNYFNSETVADEFIEYQPIFVGLKAAKEERSSKTFNLPESRPKAIKTWWYSAAALLVVAFGVGSFYFSQPNYSQEEKDALAAFEKSKNAMMLLSENLNKGAEQIVFIDQFTITKDRIFE